MSPHDAVEAVSEALRVTHGADGDPPTLWFTSAVLSPAGLVVTWAGNDETFVVRGNEPPFHAKGHRVEFSKTTSVLVKGIGGGYRPPNFETATFPVSRGDRIVIASDSAVRDHRAEVEALVLSKLSSREIAFRLSRLCTTGPRRPFAAAAVAVV
jgi:hypothetical protein